MSAQMIETIRQVVLQDGRRLTEEEAIEIIRAIFALEVTHD